MSKTTTGKGDVSCLESYSHHVHTVHLSVIPFLLPCMLFRVFLSDQNQNWRDARASFILVAGDEDSNGSSSPSATVKRMSINPSLDADLHLNPPGGMLSGTDRATAFGGWVYFRDLFVRTRGQGYKMNFEAVLSDLKLAALSASSVSSYSALSSSASSSSSSGGGGGGGEGGVALKQSTTFEVSRLLCSWSVGTYSSMKHRASH